MEKKERPLEVRVPKLRQVLVTESPLILLFIIAIIFSSFVDERFQNIIQGLSFIILIRILYKVMYIKTIKYSLLKEQLEFQHGVFHRVKDYLELYRVTDYQEDSNFLQLLLRLKTLRLLSGDKTNPQLNIIGLDLKDNFKVIVRDIVEKEKKIKKVYEITNR